MIIMVLMIFVLFSLLGLNVGALKYSGSVVIDEIDASYVGGNNYCETFVQHLGFPVSLRGDVNGDGYDDVLMGSENGSFLVFGRPDGWGMKTPIADADVNFLPTTRFYGNDLGILGDFNGDGYDDMYFKMEGNVSILFGKADGWSKEIDLRGAANLVFQNDSKGGWYMFIAGLGDVNGDGFDDLCIVPPAGPAKYSDISVFLIFGRADGWGKRYIDLNSTDISSFEYPEIRKESFAFYTVPIAGAGDINGDGYDDILIRYSSEEDIQSGLSHIAIFFGKPAGWGRDMSLDSSDASLMSATYADNIDGWMDIRGDYNGDGFDDILAGVNLRGGCNDACTGAYLFFGREQWPRNISTSEADASFTIDFDDAGADITVTSAGDVNYDGYDDILMGHEMYSDPVNFSGAAYLILGRGSGWTTDVPLLMAAEVTFLGVTDNDAIGEFIGGGGDINGDGFDDIVISSHTNPPPEENYRGEVFIVFLELTGRPTDFTSLRVCGDEDCTNLTNTGYYNDTIWIELRGADRDPKSIDTVEIQMSRNKGSPPSSRLFLTEAGSGHGVFRTRLTIDDRMDLEHGLLGAMEGEMFTFNTIEGPILSTSYTVGTLELLSDEIPNTIDPGTNYTVRYWTKDNISVDWRFETDASWLTWDPVRHVVTGTPNGNMAGTYLTRVTVSRGVGHSVERERSIVVNPIPVINHDPIGVMILSPADGSMLNESDARNLVLTASASDPDIDDILTFRWFVNGTQVAEGRDARISLAEGTHSIELQVSDGHVVVSRNATVHVRKPNPPPPVDGPHPKPLVERIVSSIRAISASIALAAVITPLTMALVMIGLVTEVGKYNTALALAPLYSRTRKEAILDNFKRGQIYMYIIDHPGVHYGRILEELELNNGTAAFHLKKLEMDQYIVSKTDGFKKRFYPYGTPTPSTPTKYEQIVSLIRLRPGITQKELAKELGIPISTVFTYIKKMRDIGMLTTSKDGKKLRCFLAKEE